MRLFTVLFYAESNNEKPFCKIFQNFDDAVIFCEELADVNGYEIESATFDDNDEYREYIAVLIDRYRYRMIIELKEV